MNEKDLAIIEQYDLQVQSFRRGRGSFLLETDRGLKLLTEFSGTDRRLRFQNSICEKISSQSPVQVDRVLENKEGNLISKDREERGYIVKDWFEGRECSTRSEEEILLAVRLLAGIHRVMRLPEEAPVPPGKVLSDRERFGGISLDQEFAKKLREMKKVRTYMRGRHPKTAFEQKFLDAFDPFYDQALEAAGLLETTGFAELRARNLEEGCVCHGDYNQHHVFLAPGSAAVMDFSRARYDIQVVDLYQFLRKMLEKQDWDPGLGMRILEEYGKVCSLSDQEVKNIWLRLKFPEKFWKLSNHYYNSKKSRMPEKGMEKLSALIDQEEKRRKFINLLES
ncbi:MAG: CotS family spore coat protein [Candidatus Limivivens sp.]|nr:CotS family spore coat protein [Candidatus Limivivens sp.]